MPTARSVRDRWCVDGRTNFRTKLFQGQAPPRRTPSSVVRGCSHLRRQPGMSQICRRSRTRSRSVATSANDGAETHTSSEQATGIWGAGAVRGGRAVGNGAYGVAEHAASHTSGGRQIKWGEEGRQSPATEQRQTRGPGGGVNGRRGGGRHWKRQRAPCAHHGAFGRRAYGRDRVERGSDERSV